MTRKNAIMIALIISSIKSHVLSQETSSFEGTYAALEALYIGVLQGGLSTTYDCHRSDEVAFTYHVVARPQG